jgi:hypothetical protein
MFGRPAKATTNIEVHHGLDQSQEKGKFPMSPERTRAYRRVVQTLDDLGPSKLLDPEQDRVRDAADSLIFSADLAEDTAAREALEDVERLCNDLVGSGRWEQVTADRLAADVAACGPEHASQLEAA